MDATMTDTLRFFLNKDFHIYAENSRNPSFSSKDS